MRELNLHAILIGKIENHLTITLNIDKQKKIKKQRKKIVLDLNSVYIEGLGGGGEGLVSM